MSFRNLAPLFLLSFLAAARATEIPADAARTRSLDGTWRFKLEQLGTPAPRGRVSRPPKIERPASPEPFERLDYLEDASWHDLKVPGNWEMSGYSPVTYWQPDNASGLYRLWFEVPAEWSGQTIKLNFDGVQNGAEIFVNGQPVDVNEPAAGRRNYHEGGWDPFQSDITPAVKFGARNLLALRVTKNHRTSDLDSGDYFFLGGIHRTVTLFAVPPVHVEELIVQTTLREGDDANVKVILALRGHSGGTGESSAVMRLRGQPALEARADAEGRIEFNQVVASARLWSAEHPNLYDLAIELRDANGQVTQRLGRRVGIREVSIRDGVLFVNRVPVKLTGICRHELYPTVGTAVGEEVWREDLALMKAANINAIRTSHYPYGAGFYALCDELGFYVADEMSACWVGKTPEAKPVIDAPEFSDDFRQRARAMVRRDRNHPSVILWAVGNENDKGRNNRVAAEEIRRLDPTRPRLVSRHDAEEGGVEFDDRHYRTPERIATANAAARARIYPHVFLENPNVWEYRNGADFGCIDLWGHIIERSWQEIWKDDHIPGSFLWEWHDRAVLDPNNAVHLYEHDETTGLSFVKTKGIVDAFRHPRASYFHLKMAYAPLKIEPEVDVGADAISLYITNRHSFTDLAELTVAWHLVADGRDVRVGSAHVPLAPRTRGKTRLALPPAALREADTLRLEFLHSDGRNVATYQFPLRPAAAPGLALDAAKLSGIKFPRLNVVTVKPDGWRGAPQRRAGLAGIMLERANGDSPVAMDEAALHATPLAEVRALSANLVMRDKPADTVGHVRVEFRDGRFSYRLDWSGAKAVIQEIGWIFTAPRNLNHFSWNRKAYWSWYPSTHIGRPAGTATPESSAVSFTNTDRPDAFDFNSTKYDCNWAKLTDAGGRGIGVAFDPQTRQHCRGHLGSDGTYGLVVNRYCCPPHDISSGTVRDLYFGAESGTVVECTFRVGSVR